MKNLLSYLILSALVLTCNDILAEEIFPSTLSNSKNSQITIDPKESEITVLEWFNKGCPFVKKFYSVGFMQELQEKYTKKGVSWYTINSTKEGHSDFIKVEERAALAEELKVKSTEMLYDEKGIFGKKVGAKTTPHVFIFKGKNLIYAGAVDDVIDTETDPKNAENYLVKNLDILLQGQTPEVTKGRPYGCSIKYAE